MTRDAVAAMIDHAVLGPACTEADIIAACELVRAHRVGCLCVPPCWVDTIVRELTGSRTKPTSVIGFPFGYTIAAAKSREADELLARGCLELDMVMNHSMLRAGRVDDVTADIASVAGAMGASADGPILKVILETCFLSDEQIALGVAAAVDGGAQFVKTSTGFGSHGATTEHVRLLRTLAPAQIGVKAAGGIRTLGDLEAMVAAGASRIGTSATADILAEIRD